MPNFAKDQPERDALDDKVLDYLISEFPNKKIAGELADALDEDENKIRRSLGRLEKKGAVKSEKRKHLREWTIC